MTDPEPPARRPWLLLLPWLVLAAGLALTFLSWQHSKRDLVSTLGSEFEHAVDEVAGHLAEHLETNAQILSGVAALFHASRDVSRGEFAHYVASLGLQERYPGIRAVGFSRLIAPDEKAAHLAQVRREGFPDYAIHPDGARDFYAPVVYIEPFADRNLRAFGYDITAEPARWAAASRARDTGEPSLSAKVILQQDQADQAQPGFILLMPVYAQDAQLGTPEQRRLAIRGWVFSALRMADLMSGVLPQEEGRRLGAMMDIQIDDVDLPRDAAPLFSSHEIGTAGRAALFNKARQLAIGGRTWSIQASSTPAFETRLSRGEHLWVAATGAILSLMLALLIMTLLRGQRHIAAALAETRRNLDARQRAEERIRALNASLEQRVAARTTELQAEIAEREQTEQRLRGSERRFRELFEYLPLAYQSLDSEGRWLDANQAMADLMGFAHPEEMLGLPFQTYWDETTRTAFPAMFDAFKRNRVAQGELRLRRRDGSRLTVFTSGRTQLDEDGRLLRTHCIMLDISARLAMEEQIRTLNADLERKVTERTAELVAAKEQIEQTMARMAQSEAKFRAIFEQSPLGVALFDAQTGQLIDANARLLGLLRMSQDELGRIGWQQITHPDDLAMELTQVTRLCAREITGFQMEKRYLLPDGILVWGHLTITTINLADGSALHLAQVEDITERKRYEQALRQARDAAESANRAKSEFLAHMSHEIRTPLNAVLGLAQLLERDRLTADQREMVTRIQEAGQSLLSILNDVLDLSKIEAGQLQMESRPFDPRALLEKLTGLLRQGAESKGLALRVESTTAMPERLLGDGQRLEQVLMNLLGNAIKFTDQGEVGLQVRVVATDDQRARLRFDVYDSGIGIAPEVLPRLFTPFTQAESGVSRRYGGTGLGLSICKRLVELMGGQIGAESTPGVGSRFWCELPFASTGASAVESLPATTSTPAPTAVRQRRLTGLHVLVVDDSAMNRDLVERVLALEGARVTTAADGQQALQQLKLRSSAFDAVLMDVQMPVLDGLSATRAIRDQLGLGELPVIALTAGVLPEQLQAARAAGVDDFLAKPLDLERLVGCLLRWTHPPVLEDTAAKQPSLTPAEQAREPSADLPEISGIDRKRAEQTLGKDPGFFLQILEQFAGQFATAVEQTRADLARGEQRDAARRMHTLRGSAGNIGAIALMQSAAALEAAIDAGETALDEPLELLDRQLEAIITASAPLIAAATSAEASTPVETHITLDFEQLEALRRALRNNNLSALRLFELLEPGLMSALGSDVVSAIGRAIRAMRFGEALALLDQASSAQVE